MQLAPTQMSTTDQKECSHIPHMLSVERWNEDQAFFICFIWYMYSIFWLLSCLAFVEVCMSGQWTLFWLLCCSQVSVFWHFSVVRWKTELWCEEINQRKKKKKIWSKKDMPYDKNQWYQLRYHITLYYAMFHLYYNIIWYNVIRSNKKKHHNNIM